MMSRPIVKIDESSLIYAPAFCEDSFRHVVLESHRGAFEVEYFDSSAMRKYVGRANERRGMSFNNVIAEIFREAGWQTETEVQMTQLLTPKGEAAGDIDVLAWRENSICICECKELLLARNVTEIVEQLRRFRGEPGDDLYKHLRRFRWLGRNPNSLAKLTGIRDATLRSLLVTSKTVPMQFASGLDVEIFSEDRLRKALQVTRRL